MYTTERSSISFWHTILWCAVFSMALTSFLGRATAKDLVQSETDKLQGTWKLVYQEINGKKLPDERTAEMFHGKMVFMGNKIRYTVELPSFDFDIAYKLQPDQQPKAIDLEMKAADTQGGGLKTYGIYLLEGDALKICYNKTKRPTEFEAAEGSDNVLIVLKKVSASQ